MVNRFKLNLKNNGGIFLANSVSNSIVGHIQFNECMIRVIGVKFITGKSAHEKINDDYDCCDGRVLIGRILHEIRIDLPNWVKGAYSVAGD